jgi:2-keto-3-deoxy-L-rhamnonate aldolase RhmA
MSNLKARLKSNEATIGAWITLAHPAIAEIFSQVQFDWIVVDLEHSVISLREMEELIRIISLNNITPLVRITNNDQNLIKRVMDAGAHGILVPMVKTIEDIQKAHKAMTYPISGNRGVGLARAQKYGEAFEDYLEFSKNELILIPQIEHIDAVNNIENILKMDEVDGIILGPYDLSGSMGIPGQFTNKDLKDKISHTVKIAKSLRKPCGIHIIEPNPAEIQERMNQGMNFLAYSLDIRILASSISEGVKSFKNFITN